MRYAIVESGGKQYRAVEGESIEVDRLPVEAGEEVDLKQVLLMADGEEIMVGTPVVGGIQVKATVLDHFRGPKVFRFKYSPKKRIRVRGGHRQQYTRLMVNFIGKPGEAQKAEKPAKEEVEAPAEKQPKAGRQAKGPAMETAEKKASAGKSTSKKKPTTSAKSGRK